MPLARGKQFKPLTIGVQVWVMHELFPQFKYHRTSSSWIGDLQPSTKSPIYMVEIKYKPLHVPRVYVLSPDIAQDAPHRYHDDGALCLYYPKDGSWSSEFHIAKTIVPWTAEWLRFYEIWCTTGKWFGPEAPHSPNK